MKFRFYSIHLRILQTWPRSAKDLFALSQLKLLDDDPKTIQYQVKLGMPGCKIYQRYRQQPTSTQIGIGICLNFSLVLIIILITLSLQYRNIKSSQLELPSRFFEPYNQFALEQTANLVKQLILVIIDRRNSFLTGLRNSLLTDSSQFLPSPFSSDPYKQKCLITRPSSTIFQCETDLFMRYYVQSGWYYEERGTSRRMNVIYVNKQDQGDIMAKTISSVNDFKLSNITKIIDRLHDSDETIFKFTSFYTDYYGNSLEQLAALYTKISFPDYEVLLEMQTFGRFLTRPLSRVIYSDDTNVLILARNRSQPMGYRFVSYHTDPDPRLNYTQLLNLGYQLVTLSDNTQVLAYSLSLSSEYRLGESASTSTQQQINKQFVIVVHTTKVTALMESRVYGFVDSLSSVLYQFLGVSQVILFSMLLLIFVKVTTEMKASLLIIKELMHGYAYEKQHQIKSKPDIARMSFGSLFRTIVTIIKGIEVKKERFRKISTFTKTDHFPLNLMEEKFQQRQNWTDLYLYEDLRQRICRSEANAKLNILPTVEQRGQSRQDPDRE